MDLLVVGMPSVRDRDRVHSRLSALHAATKIRRLTVRDRRGAEEMARDWARANKVPLKVLRPEARHGFGSYVLMNHRAVINASHVVVFVRRDAERLGLKGEGAGWISHLAKQQGKLVCETVCDH